MHLVDLYTNDKINFFLEPVGLNAKLSVDLHIYMICMCLEELQSSLGASKFQFVVPESFNCLVSLFSFE